PPLGEIGAGVDVILANEGELAVVSDSEHREGGWNDAHLIALAYRDRDQASRYQDAPAGVKRERARVRTLGIGSLDQGRLAALLVDGVDRDRALIGGEHGPAFEALLIGCGGHAGAIGEIDKAAVGMHVDRARRGGVLVRSQDRALDEQRLWRETAIRRQPIDIDLVLALDRYKHPGLRWMEIEMPRPEAKPGAGLNCRLVAECTVLEAEHAQPTRVLRRGRRRIIAARHQQH